MPKYPGLGYFGDERIVCISFSRQIDDLPEEDDAKDTG